jgi:hypothetical protein
MDIMVILYVAGGLIVGGIVFSILTFIVSHFWHKSKIVFYDAQASTNTTPIIDIFGDNYAEIDKGEKSLHGSILYNANTPQETVDTSVIDNKPSLNIGGKRYLVKVRLSPINIDPKDAAFAQLVINYFDAHRSEYPLLAKLQDYEWGGAITHDPKTSREVLMKFCIVEPTWVDKDGREHKRTDAEIKALQEKNVQGYVDEITKLVNSIQKEVYIDWARVVNFTQCKIRSAALRQLWAEMEKLVRLDLQKQMGAFANGVAWYWCPICVGIGFILAIIALQFVPT